MEEILGRERKKQGERLTCNILTRFVFPGTKKTPAVTTSVGLNF